MILFLFFVSNLLEELNYGSTTACGFVDDTHLLAFRTLTEDNCRALKAVYEKCAIWARTHGATFAPEKYHLMHLTRRPKKHNMAAVVTIPGFQGKPCAEIKILGVQVDSKLRWGPHIKLTYEKAMQQTNTLTRLVNSTWGASFARARHIYTAVVRPKITYGCSIWHSPEGTPGYTKSKISKLEKVQNQCLRRITGAYKTTNIRVLEHEAAIPPLRNHMDGLAFSYTRRHNTPDPHPAVIEGCVRVERILRQRQTVRKRSRIGQQTNLLPLPTRGESLRQKATAIL